MIELTNADKLRIAEEADKLAAKIEIEGAPITLDEDNWCGCGMGHVLQAAGFIPRPNSFAADHRIDPLSIANVGSSDLSSLASVLDASIGGVVTDATTIAVLRADPSFLPPALRKLSAFLRAEVGAA